MRSYIFDKLHLSLSWPEPGQIFNPSGAGPAAYSRLVKAKIQVPLELELGRDQVHVGILAGNPNSDESDVPIAIVCDFNRAITPDELNFTRKLAWNFCHAKLLITIEPQLIRTWSCYEKPDEQTGKFPCEPITSEGEKGSFDVDALIDTLHWVQLATGQYFTINQKYFDRDQRADTTLLKNLEYVRKKLTSDLPNDIAHNLLARVVFLQFLFDRKDSGGIAALNKRKLLSLYNEEVLSKEHDGLSSILRHKTDTFTLFKWLNGKFNGDLFPKSLTEEERRVKKEHLVLLADFVSGSLKMDNGQYMLWPHYSFDTIPLEFISSIYEEFVTKRDDEEDGTGIGEHYTRPFLVDFLLDKVLPWRGTDYDLKILDPCCGSAVFLVKAFQRLVQRWRNANPDMEPSASFLRELLEKNLFGVDTNPNAIHVASFSLYLAMCDEIDPKHYWSQVRFPSLRDNRIKHADFFSEDIPEISSTLKEEDKYDLIIGNAPWGEDSLTEKAREWSSQYGWEPVDEQSGTLFISKALMLCKEAGFICMIQPAGAMLFNISPTALKFRKQLFNNYKVEEVTNLSALRFLDLFPNAIGPACIIKLQPKDPDGSVVAYWTPKHVHSKEEERRIVVDLLDLNWIWPEEAAEEPFAWPALTWGSRRDLFFILKLKNNNETIESNDHIYTSRGFTRGKNGEEYVQKLGLPVLEGKEGKRIWNNLPIYSAINNFPVNDNPCFVRVRDDNVFRLPAIVMKETWSIQANNKFKAVLVKANKNDVLLFSNTYMGIKSDNVDLLKALHLTLNSSFAVYYFFLSSGRLASYVPALRDEDLKKLPLPAKRLPHSKLESLGEKGIDNLVQDFYSLNDIERALVTDFIDITIHDYKDSEAPIGRHPVNSLDDIKLYCEWFLNVLKSGFGDDKSICATIFNSASDRNSTFNIVAIHLDWPRKKSVDCQSLEKAELFKKLNELEQEQKRQNAQKTIFYNRVSRIYQTVPVEENGEMRKVPTVFLIKPNQVRYWTRSVALRDADEVAFDIMQWAEFDGVKKEKVLDAQQ